jgi:hypothetical protein
MVFFVEPVSMSRHYDQITYRIREVDVALMTRTSF